MCALYHCIFGDNCIYSLYELPLRNIVQECAASPTWPCKYESFRPSLLVSSHDISVTAYGRDPGFYPMVFAQINLIDIDALLLLRQLGSGLGVGRDGRHDGPVGLLDSFFGQRGVSCLYASFYVVSGFLCAHSGDGECNRRAVA